MVNDLAARLDALVGDWLTLPDLAETLGLDLGKVRRLLQDRHLVGVKRGERAVFQVPAAFVIDAADQPPGTGLAGAKASGGQTGKAVLGTLRGTVVVLSDAGFGDAEILEWLFTPDDSLGGTPVGSLLAGRRAEVRRLAQAQL